VTLRPGARLMFDGDVVEIVQWDGASVTVRNDRTGRFEVLTLSRLVAGARALVVPGSVALESVGVVLAGLTKGQLAQVAVRAKHVREVLSGDPGDGQDAVTGLLGERMLAKATELGVTLRTMQRWVAAYRRDGEAGLVDSRVLRGRGAGVDARWDEAVRQVLAERVKASTPTRSAVLAAVEQRLAADFGVGVVPLPSRATGYRRLEELTKGSNAVRGSAKGRRSIAERPQGVYGRLRPTRPGEYLILDTQDLDVFAMEPVTCRWVGVQLTVAQDLFSRCIVGLRCTPVSTKAVDVAGVLFEAVVPQSPAPGWPAEACWPYHGLPSQVVFDEDEPMRGPVCAPETLVVDHGKVFLSAHVISVCTRLGISIQPAQVHKPTDKTVVSYCAPSV
jgi:putative transposase